MRNYYSFLNLVLVKKHFDPTSKLSNCRDSNICLTVRKFLVKLLIVFEDCSFNLYSFSYLDHCSPRVFMLPSFKITLILQGKFEGLAVIF